MHPFWMYLKFDMAKEYAKLWFIPNKQEGDKISLAEVTGLDQRQINNWFINQRKRHWKPSENMQLAVMDSLSGQFYAD